MGDLGIAQHLLGGEGAGGQVLEPLRRRPAFPQAPVEGGVAGEAPALFAPVRLSNLGELTESKKVFVSERQARLIHVARRTMV